MKTTKEQRDYENLVRYGHTVLTNEQRDHLRAFDRYRLDQKPYIACDDCNEPLQLDDDAHCPECGEAYEGLGCLCNELASGDWSIDDVLSDATPWADESEAYAELKYLAQRCGVDLDRLDGAA